ncbi:MAG: hypothetical protein JSR80_00600, partial [Verrucomicrobia bacterium]|nr:hypothetical protein [Verrucomicrobiota bacterium]
MIEEKKRPLLRSPHSGEEIADSDEIQRRLDRLASEGLEEASFPVIQWWELKAQTCFVVQVLCRTRDGIELHEFFCEMLRRRLVFGRYLPLKQTQMWVFHVEEEEFYLGEVTLLVDRGKDAREARDHFSLLVPEIRLGLTSKSWAWDLLQTRGLAPHRKVDLVDQGMLSILRRYPQAFDRTILEDVQHFLLLTVPEYREIRGVPHLCRIIYSLHMLRGETRKALQLDPTSRQLALRVMRAPLFYAFGKKRVLGIAVALSVLLNYELLDSEHVAKAVKQLTPRLTLLEGSFFCYQHPNDPIRAVYFEVESVQDPPPSGEEVAKLRKELAGELKGRVERLAHPVFN